MAKKSRDKGARFERRVAKLFSEAFNRNIRRTPNLLHRNPDNVVGKRIKSDIYAVDNKSFPYFVECKYREDFSFGQLTGNTSKLFDFLSKTAEISGVSFVYPEKGTHKHKRNIIPLVVFKGGHFQREMVMFCECDTDDIFRKEKSIFLIKCGEYGDLQVTTLNEFLDKCNKSETIKFKFVED